MTKPKRKAVILTLILVWVACIMISCTPVKSPGEFFLLEEAYEKGVITKVELQNIADAYNSYKGKDNSFYRDKVGELEENIAEKIKQTHLDKLIAENVKNAKLSCVHIGQYYGKYNDCYAVSVHDEYRVSDVFFYDEYIIYGVKFYNFSNYFIQLWKENKN